MWSLLCWCAAQKERHKTSKHRPHIALSGSSTTRQQLYDRFATQATRDSEPPAASAAASPDMSMIVRRSAVHAQARQHQMNNLNGLGWCLGSPMPMAARILPQAQQAHLSGQQPAAFGGTHHAEQACSPQHLTTIEAAEPKAKRVCHGLASAEMPVNSVIQAADNKAGFKQASESLAAMAQAEE